MHRRLKTNFPAVFSFQIYAISDSISVLLRAIEGGAAIVQLRDKSENFKIIGGKAREIVAYKKKQNFIFILNDYPELAQEAGADGVHIGQDFSTAEARKIIGPRLILGKSTHSLEQGLQAEKEGVDYISVGPVFPTPTKPDRKAVGLEYVKEAAAKINIPFVAIGGINLNNIEEVILAGAKTIGVVRASTEVKELLTKCAR